MEREPAGVVAAAVVLRRLKCGACVGARSVCLEPRELYVDGVFCEAVLSEAPIKIDDKVVEG